MCRVYLQLSDPCTRKAILYRKAPCPCATAASNESI